MWKRRTLIVIMSFSYIRAYATTDIAEWAIVGAGPAGIVVAGLLLDVGVPAQQIYWIDPEFNVGRLSTYLEVPANSTLKSFIDFLQACKTFAACHSPKLDSLSQYNAEKEYPLQLIVESLQDISQHLYMKMKPIKGMLRALDFIDGNWSLMVDGTRLTARRVVLATGSHPRSLHYPCRYEIPLDIALNKSQLATQIAPDDTIAVVGSAHSAVLVMKFLSELNVARIINFYNKQFTYVVNMGTYELNAAHGLRGVAAEWAKNVLEKNLPANLIRILNTEASLKAWLGICNKIIYAVGYDPNQLPPINGSQRPLLYDDTTGVIAPRLFGIGIAFPGAFTDHFGNKEHRIGLNSFMAYAQQVLPGWIATKDKDFFNRFRLFEDLFAIDIL